MIDEVERALQKHGLIQGSSGSSLAPLALGDGKFAYILDRPDGGIFVKRSVPHWWRIEAALQRLVAVRCPGLALPVLGELPEIHAFVMPHLPSGAAAAWTALQPLDEAEVELQAARCGDRLGELHAHTTGDAEIANVAEANRNRAEELGYASFPLCVAFRPALRSIVYRTIAETFACRTSLAHGDANQGNILLASDRIILIDFEKAWFGDPAFDAGWLLGSLIVNALRTRDNPARPWLPARLRGAGKGWLGRVDWEARDRAEGRAVRIALMRSITYYQNLVQQHRRPGPAWIVAEIDRLADRLAQDMGTVAALADTFRSEASA